MKKYYGCIKPNISICWNCKKASGFCSWSQLKKPVDGWQAEYKYIADNYPYCDSYVVRSCPQFVPDFCHPVKYDGE